MLSKVRERMGDLMEPMAKAFARTGLPPNAFTSIGLAVGAVAALLFAYGMQLLAGLALLVCGFFDLIDGAVARVVGGETAFGGVLDSVADRYVDFIIFFGIAWGGLVEFGWPELPAGLSSWMWAMLALVGSFMVSYTRARAEAAGSGRLDVGLAERGERILVLAIGALFSLTHYAVIIVVILTHFTVAQRLYTAKIRLP